MSWFDVPDAERMAACDGWSLGVGLESQRDGVWGATRLDQKVFSRLWECAMPLDASTEVTHTPQTDEIHRAGLRWLIQSGEDLDPSGIPDLVATGSWNGRSVLWSGYLINSATLLGLGMWFWFTPLVIRDVWRWRRSRRGGCAPCGYDLAGLTSPVCPECGTPIPAPILTDG